MKKKKTFPRVEKNKILYEDGSYHQLNGINTCYFNRNDFVKHINNFKYIFGLTNLQLSRLFLCHQSKISSWLKNDFHKKISRNQANYIFYFDQVMEEVEKIALKEQSLDFLMKKFNDKEQIFEKIFTRSITDLLEIKDYLKKYQSYKFINIENISI